MSKPSHKLILALDGMSGPQAIELIRMLPDLCWVKVGLELFVNEGPKILHDLHAMGLNIFLDLKFHDIPQTMSGACYQAAKTGVKLITVHACAGKSALKAAQDGAYEGALQGGFPLPTLLAVTVLTSWEQNKFQRELLINQSLERRVRLLAELAQGVGIGGCVCSPLEVKDLRQVFPDPFQLITPGIRPNGYKTDDQSRTMTALDAIKAGASRLVVGRPVTKAKEPQKVFKSLCDALKGL